MFDVIDDDEDDDLELSVMSMEDSLERTEEKTRGLTIFEVFLPKFDYFLN